MATSTLLTKKLEEEKHKRRLKTDIVYFAEHAVKLFEEPDQNLVPSACHRLLLQKLAKVASGEIRNLMVFMPSGSAKTTYLSKIFPAWLMAARPMINVIAATSTVENATDVSAEVQMVLNEFREELGAFPVSENKTNWRVSNRSSYRCAGVGGKIMGTRADLFIIDDPFGSIEDAYSAAVRDKIYKWYKGVVSTRMKKGGAKVVLHQRLHMDDLVGRLLEEERDRWEVLYLPAIWEHDYPDELGRQYGDLLWPEYMDHAFLEERRLDVGEIFFASMFQQNPLPQGGLTFKPEIVGRIDASEVPPCVGSPVRAWDMAGSSSKRADWTVGILMQKNPNGTYTILDEQRFKATADELERRVLETARSDGHGVHIALSQDPGQAGTYQIQAFTRLLAGYYVTANRETGSKEVRAQPFAAQVNAGNVTVVRGAWNQDFLDELATFPGGRWDDRVDSASKAFTMLAQERTYYRKPRFGSGSFLGR